MNKILGSGLVVIAIIAIAGIVYPKTETIVGANGSTGPQGPQGIQGVPGPAGRDGTNGRDGKSGNVLGAVSGPDTYFDYTANNDLRKFGTTRGFLTGTTTVCAIKSPVATSSLVFAGVNFITSSTTASVITLAKAATPYATTTSLGVISAGANGQVVGTASTTGAHIFSPNTYFVVGMQGGVGTFSPTGNCSAEFVRI